MNSQSKKSDQCVTASGINIYSYKGLVKKKISSKNKYHHQYLTPQTDTISVFS